MFQLAAGHAGPGVRTVNNQLSSRPQSASAALSQRKAPSLASYDLNRTAVRCIWGIENATTSKQQERPGLVVQSQISRAASPAAPHKDLYRSRGPTGGFHAESRTSLKRSVSIEKRRPGTAGAASRNRVGRFSSESIRSHEDEETTSPLCRPFTPSVEYIQDKENLVDEEPGIVGKSVLPPTPTGRVQQTGKNMSMNDGTMLTLNSDLCDIYDQSTDELLRYLQSIEASIQRGETDSRALRQRELISQELDERNIVGAVHTAIGELTAPFGGDLNMGYAGSEGATPSSPSSQNNSPGPPIPEGPTVATATSIETMSVLEEADLFLQLQKEKDAEKHQRERRKSLLRSTKPKPAKKKVEKVAGASNGRSVSRARSQSVMSTANNTSDASVAVGKPAALKQMSRPPTPTKRKTSLDKGGEQAGRANAKVLSPSKRIPETMASGKLPRPRSSAATRAASHAEPVAASVDKVTSPLKAVGGTYERASGGDKVDIKEKEILKAAVPGSNEALLNAPSCDKENLQKVNEDIGIDMHEPSGGVSVIAETVVANCTETTGKCETFVDDATESKQMGDSCQGIDEPAAGNEGEMESPAVTVLDSVQGGDGRDQAGNCDALEVSVVEKAEPLHGQNPPAIVGADETQAAVQMEAQQGSTDVDKPTEETKKESPDEPREEVVDMVSQIVDVAAIPKKSSCGRPGAKLMEMYDASGVQTGGSGDAAKSAGESACVLTCEGKNDSDILTGKTSPDLVIENVGTSLPAPDLNGISSNAGRRKDVSPLRGEMPAMPEVLPATPKEVSFGDGCPVWVGSIHGKKKAKAVSPLKAAPSLPEVDPSTTPRFDHGHSSLRHRVDSDRERPRSAQQQPCSDDQEERASNLRQSVDTALKAEALGRSHSVAGIVQTEKSEAREPAESQSLCSKEKINGLRKAVLSALKTSGYMSTYALSAKEDPFTILTEPLVMKYLIRHEGKDVDYIADIIISTYFATTAARKQQPKAKEESNDADGGRRPGTADARPSTAGTARSLRASDDKSMVTAAGSGGKVTKTLESPIRGSPSPTKKAAQKLTRSNSRLTKAQGPNFIPVFPNFEAILTAYGAGLEGSSQKVFADIISSCSVWKSLVERGNEEKRVYRVSQNKNEVTRIVNNAMSRLPGWVEAPQGCNHSWNLLWTWSKPKINYNDLMVWQRVNHFQGAKELTRKDRLKKYIERQMRALGPKLGEAFDIMPTTYSLPKEYVVFVDDFTRQQESDPDHNFWIMKPVGLSRGRGIFVLNNIQSVSYGDQMVIQRYVHNPLTMHGYKFDLRLYVLVTSMQPLEVFLYKEGFARVSSEKYSDDINFLKNKYIHLTNSSIQRHTSAAKFSNDPHVQGGSKLSLAYLQEYLEGQGIDYGVVWSRVIDVILRSLHCVQDAIPAQVNSFEVFGYDVLIDQNLRAWLLEVNSSPAMSVDNTLDERIKQSMIEDTIRLVDPLPFNRTALAQACHKRCDEKHRDRWRNNETLNQELHGILDGRLPRKVGEMPADMGNYERIAPSKYMDALLRSKKTTKK